MSKQNENRKMQLIVYLIYFKLTLMLSRVAVKGRLKQMSEEVEGILGG